MENENDSFSIHKDKAFTVIIDMLIDITAHIRTLQQKVFEDVETKEDLDETLSDLKKSIAFHKDEVYKYLFENYSDLKDFLPPNIHQPED